MDSSTINLFLEEEASTCLDTKWSYWALIEDSEGWLCALLGSVSWFEECWPHLPHYWSGDSKKLEQFALDTITYSNTRKYLGAETLAVRSKLLNIAENIQLFGDSVIKAIDGTSAGTNTQNLSQAQIDDFNSSLLSIEDSGCVQSFSSHMDALRESISGALDDVSTFQSKVSKLKFLLANNVRPNVEGALAFSYPRETSSINDARTRIEEGKKNGISIEKALFEEKMFLDLRNALAKAKHEEVSSPLIFGHLLMAFLELSESISRVQPALSKFELLWIETSSFILNSKDNVNTIKDIKMLKVFRVRMKKIMEDWNNVKTTLGAQPVIRQ